MRRHFSRQAAAWRNLFNQLPKPTSWNGECTVKILIIDDSALMRKICRHRLEEAGFEIDGFLPSSVGEPAKRIIESPPALVLSYFNMPNIDGRNVAQTVRRADSKIPVAILSLNCDTGRDVFLETLGARKTLNKPIKGKE